MAAATSFLNFFPPNFPLSDFSCPQLGMSANELALSKLIPPPTILSKRNIALIRLIRMQRELNGGGAL